MNNIGPTTPQGFDRYSIIDTPKFEFNNVQKIVRGFNTSSFDVSQFMSNFAVNSVVKARDSEMKWSFPNHDYDDLYKLDRVESDLSGSLELFVPILDSNFLWKIL